MYNQKKRNVFAVIMCIVVLMTSTVAFAGQNTGEVALDQGSFGRGSLIVNSLENNHAIASTWTVGVTQLGIISTTAYAYSGNAFSTDYGISKADAYIMNITYGESVHVFGMGRTINLYAYA